MLSRVLPMAAGLFAIGNDVGVTIYEEIDAVGAWTSADGRSWEKAGTLEGLVPKAALLESDGTNLVALRNGKAMWVSTDGRDWQPVSTTGDPARAERSAGPVRVQPASPMSHDTPMWVTDRELIFGYPVDSPEGFAVVQMQLGTTSP